MVMCKYFLRGTCRFGENCKNEHTYNVSDNTPESVLRKKQDVDPNMIIKSVSNDMDKAEHGNQWPFTCYGPFQGKPCFPGFEDKCFEEIRLGLYEAEKNGTVEQYKQQLTQLLNETRMKMRSLQNPTPEAANLLKELFNTNQSGTNTNIFTNTSNSPFGNTANPPTIFGNTPAVSQNIFATQPVANTANNFNFTIPENKSIFGNTAASQVSAGSIFNQNNQPGFASGNNIFTGSTTKSIFAQQNFAPPNANVFQTSPTNQNVGSIFAQNTQVFAQQPTTGGSIFSSTSPFAQNVPTNQENPFKQHTNTIDPFRQSTTDLFRQNTATTDVFRQNTATTDVFRQNIAPTDPFRQNTAPFQQNTGLFQQSTAPFQQNTAPFQQNTALFQQNTDQIQQNTTPVSNQSPFSQSSFAQNSVLHAQNQGTNLPDHTKSIFGSMQPSLGYQTQLDTRRQDDFSIYSKLENLTEKEIKCFEAAVFEFGTIPENPPTLQMC